MTNPFEYINSILETKEYKMLTAEDEKEFNSFLTCRALSQHIDALLYANEMNLYPDLDGKLVYDYFFHSIRKMKRFHKKWPKKLIPNDDLKNVMAYFEVNRHKAEQYCLLLDGDQLKQIQKSFEVGGLKGRK